MNLSLVAQKITPSTVIDAGANVGHWHNEARLFWPDAHFIEIEGNPACEEALRMTGAETHITLLGDYIGIATFYRRKEAPTCTGCSTHRELTEFYDDDNIEKVELPVTMLGAMFHESQLKKPILLKLDLQGAELEAIRGAEPLMDYISAIIIEVSFEEYNESAPLAEEAHQVLSRYGFELSERLGEIVHPTKRHVIQEDRLYLRK